MTDERGGRYFREARFFLAGDKVAAQSHILEARSLMGYMRDMHALGGPPIQVKYATLQDGTRIKATMMNGQYQAEIISPFQVLRAEVASCRIHMDSGIADMVSLAPESPDRYANAKLYVGTALADNTFWGQVSVPGGVGYTTIPVGAIGAAEVKSPPNVTGQEIECLQYVEPERPAGMSDEDWANEVDQGRATLYAKKLRVGYSFSSYFSGKIRLYIQAINSRLLFADDSPPPELSLTALSPPSLDAQMYDEAGVAASYEVSGNAKAVGISNNSTVSTGIYTDASNHYWYVQLVNRGSTMDATITKMQLSACGYVAAARAKESLTSDERDRFEALALSTGTPRSDVSFTIEGFCEVPTFLVSLCYGWTFKWDGSEAHIVMHNRTTSASFIAYHLQVDIHRDDTMEVSDPTLTPAEQERARWEVTGRVVEGGTPWRSKTGVQNIWVPAFGLGLLREWADTAGETPCHGDAPVYCFYDRADTLHMLRYQGEDLEPYTEQQYPPCYEAAYGWEAGVAGNFVATQRQYSVRRTGSFSCGGTSVTGEYSSAGEELTDFAITASGGESDYQYAPQTTAAYGSPCADNELALAYKATILSWHPPEEPGWLAKRVFGRLEQTYDVGLIDTAKFISVVIPWGDCAAVYLAATGTVSRSGHRVLTTNDNMTISEDSIRYNYSGETRVYYPGAASYTWRNVDQSWFGAVNTYSEYLETDPITPVYKFVGFDGVARDTEKGEWNDYMMSPALTGLFADYSFSTFSSAGQADIIGSGFTTGGYALDDRGPSWALMYNRAFIGFA